MARVACWMLSKRWRWMHCSFSVRIRRSIMPTPSLQLFGRIRKRQEPVGVQTFSPEPAIEGFDERVVRRLSWPRAVEGDAALIREYRKVWGNHAAISVSDE